MSRSIALLNGILLATICLSNGFQILGIPASLKQPLTSSIFSARNQRLPSHHTKYLASTNAAPSSSSSQLNLQKNGDSRNQTNSDMIPIHFCDVEEIVVESTSGFLSTQNTDDSTTFPFTDKESMQELFDIETLIKRTLEDEICGNEKDNTIPPLPLDDNNVKWNGDQFGYAMTDDYESEAQQQVKDLDMFIQEKLKEEAQIAKLEDLVARPDHIVFVALEELNLDTSLVDTRTGYVTNDKGVVTKTTKSPITVDNDLILARVLLIAASALYGTNFALVKILGDAVPVGAGTALRFTLASFALLPWLLPKRKVANEISDNSSIDSDNDKSSSDDDAASWGPTLAGMEVGMWCSLGYISQAVGLQTVCASKSAFICSLAVVLVPILDAFNGKVLSIQKMFGVLMAVAGVAFLEVGSSLFETGPFTVDSLGTGDLISFLQPIGFGVAFWRMEHASSRYPDETLRLTSAQIFAVAIASILYCAFLSSDGLPTVSEVMGWVSDPHILGALVWTGIVTTALTVYMETKAFRTISAAEATLILSTEPIWGSAFAALVVGEHLGFEMAIGAVMILGGCLVSSAMDNDDDGYHNGSSNDLLLPVELLQEDGDPMGLDFCKEEIIRLP